MLLRGKPDFMKQAIRLDPILFVCSLFIELQQDLYVALFFFSQQQQQQLHPQPSSSLSAIEKATAAATEGKSDFGEYIHTLDQHSSSWKKHSTRVVQQQRTFVRWLYRQLHVMFGTYFVDVGTHNTTLFRTIFERSLVGRQRLDDDTIDHFHRVVLEYLYDWPIPSITFLRQCKNAYRNLHRFQRIIESWGIDDTI